VHTRLLTTACSIALLSLFPLAATFVAQSSDAAPRPFDCAGERCDSIARGFHAFADGRLPGLDGNGRSCADCHMPDDSFQLAPGGVEARYQALLARRERHPDADDPLFRPIDADDFRTNGPAADDFTTLREHALVRVVFPLPPNLRLVDRESNLVSNESSVDVWRMVPSVNNVALTGPGKVNPWPREPNIFGGYQLDARVATLEEQALGALVNHAGITDAVPPRLLEDLSAFQRTLFSNARVQALAEALNMPGGVLPDTDPPLDALEQAGKVVFQRACTQCHAGPSQTNAERPIPHFQDISTQCPRPVDTESPPRFTFAPCSPSLARHARTYEITLSTGATMRRTSSDPGRALLTGFVGGAAPSDDWNKLDVPGLRGISLTAPYFHNNSAASLEAVVDHYIEFFKRVKANAAPGSVPPVATTDGVNFNRQPRPEERAALLAYLRKL
jgi:cytochrome c peroxidase